MSGPATAIVAAFASLFLAPPDTGVVRDPRGVQLAVKACGDAAAEIRRAAELELGVALLPASSSNPEAVQATIECTGTKSTRIVVRNPIWGDAIERPVEVESNDRGERARAIALALGEAVAASTTRAWDRPGEASAPTVRQNAAGPETAPQVGTTPVPIAAPQREVERHAAPRTYEEATWMTAALGAACAFPREDVGPAYGASLSLSRAWLPLVVVADGTFLTSERTYEPGTLELRLVSGAVSALSSARLGWVRFEAGAGVRAGAVHMKGVPRPGSDVEGRSATRSWGGPLLSGRVRVGERGLTAMLAVESGYNVRTAEAIVGTPDSAFIRGVWVAVAVGLGVSF